MSPGEAIPRADSSEAVVRRPSESGSNVDPNARSLLGQAARTGDVRHRRQLLHQALALEIEADAEYEALQSQRTHLLDRLDRISGEHAPDFDPTDSRVNEHNVRILGPEASTAAQDEHVARKAQTSATKSQLSSTANHHNRGLVPKEHKSHSSSTQKAEQATVPVTFQNALNIKVDQPAQVSIEVHTPVRSPTQPFTPGPRNSMERTLFSPGSSTQGSSSSRKKPRKLEVRSPRASPAKPTAAKKKPKKLEIRSKG